MSESKETVVTNAAPKPQEQAAIWKGDVCIVIERRVDAGQGLCQRCLDAGHRYRWTGVSRYKISGGNEDYIQLLGYGESPIAPKGMPDNLSRTTVEWLDSLRQDHRQHYEFTCLTHAELLNQVLVTPAYIHPDDNMHAAFGMPKDWLIADELDQYRAVVWRSFVAKGRKTDRAV